MLPITFSSAKKLPTRASSNEEIGEESEMGKYREGLG
jgi:hypothetical protein